VIDPRYNKALSIFQEFGPRRGLPVRQRWQEAFPKVTPHVMYEWESQFTELERFALDLATKVWNQALDANIAIQLIAERFPMLNKDRLGATYSQAMYFAIK